MKLEYLRLLSTLLSLVLFFVSVTVLIGLYNNLFVEINLNSEIFSFVALAFIAVFAVAAKPSALVNDYQSLNCIMPIHETLKIICFIIAGFSVFILLILKGPGSVPPYDDKAVFSPREKYEFVYYQNNNKTSKVVPRWKYIAVAGSFQVGWHFAVLGAVLIIQSLILFGDKKQNAIN